MNKQAYIDPDTDKVAQFWSGIFMEHEPLTRKSRRRAMITFHIRTKLPRLKSNSTYLDKHIRESKTLCGDAVTSFDVMYHDKATPWKMDAGEPFEPCERCLKIRGRNLPSVDSVTGLFNQ